jgi:outer membrane protease
LDQDVYHGGLARASGRFSAVCGGFKGSVFGGYFDVSYDYPFGRELIIRFISTGRESRRGVNAGYEVTQNIDIYAGFTYTNVALRSGRDAEGEIYRAGTELSLVKEAGVVGEP